MVAAVELADDDSTVVTDSKIALKWVSGGRCKARPDLSDVALECKRLVKEKRIKIRFRPREENLAGIYNEKNRVGEEAQPPNGG